MKTIRRFALLVLVTCVTGCASSQSQQSKFTPDTVTSIKTGMTKDDVMKLLGEPRSHSIDNDGNEIWQYRKNAQQGKAVKAWGNIASFGLTSDTDAQYIDILSVSFKDGAVVKATYEENVHNLSGLESHH
jgi:outer membrane protein assembly factor BamE (lipoprotein component of BamABCDE complex)